jgi:hypothetical protein
MLQCAIVSRFDAKSQFFLAPCGNRLKKAPPQKLIDLSRRGEIWTTQPSITVAFSEGF